jgi:hypothetical protein
VGDLSGIIRQRVNFGSFRRCQSEIFIFTSHCMGRWVHCVGFSLCLLWNTLSILMKSKFRRWRHVRAGIISRADYPRPTNLLFLGRCGQYFIPSCPKRRVVGDTTSCGAIPGPLYPLEIGIIFQSFKFEMHGSCFGENSCSVAQFSARYHLFRIDLGCHPIQLFE